MKTNHRNIRVTLLPLAVVIAFLPSYVLALGSTPVTIVNQKAAVPVTISNTSGPVTLKPAATTHVVNGTSTSGDITTPSTAAFEKCRVNINYLPLVPYPPSSSAKAYIYNTNKSILLATLTNITYPGQSVLIELPGDGLTISVIVDDPMGSGSSAWVEVICR